MWFTVLKGVLSGALELFTIFAESFPSLKPGDYIQYHNYRKGTVRYYAEKSGLKFYQIGRGGVLRADEKFEILESSIPGYGVTTFGYKFKYNLGQEMQFNPEHGKHGKIGKIYERRDYGGEHYSYLCTGLSNAIDERMIIPVYTNA